MLPLLAWLQALALASHLRLPGARKIPLAPELCPISPKKTLGNTESFLGCGICRCLGNPLPGRAAQGNPTCFWQSQTGSCGQEQLVSLLENTGCLAVGMWQKSGPSGWLQDRVALGTLCCPTARQFQPATAHHHPPSVIRKQELPQAVHCAREQGRGTATPRVPSPPHLENPPESL